MGTDHREAGLMTLVQAQAILGPIVCFYSRQQQCWTLHQKPATVKEIIAEAESWRDMRKRRARIA